MPQSREPPNLTFLAVLQILIILLKGCVSRGMLSAYLTRYNQSVFRLYQHPPEFLALAQTDADEI